MRVNNIRDLDEIFNIGSNYQRNIKGLEKCLIEEKEIANRLKQDIENKDSEFYNIKNEFERLGNVYESKIEILNNKIKMDKEKIIKLKNELKSKNDHFGETNYLNNEYKYHINSLKSGKKNKNEELSIIKKEFDKLLLVKDRKISELQGLINQSNLSCKSGGGNDVKLANTLDHEVKSLIKKFCEDKNSDEMVKHNLINKINNSNLEINNC